jgi:DNA repair exonuclease SbcCD nuclease subunit
MIGWILIMTYRIAFFADSHIGYRAKVKANSKGINIRVQDGYDAFRETINQILKSEPPIDAVLHGGDMFHYSKPTIRDIATVQHYLRELHKHDIPFYGLAGNHDATDIRSELAAVAAVNDPDRNIYALFEPYAKYELTDGIVLHSVSHHGLASGEAPSIKPEVGSLNIFTTHGAALDPKNKELMLCADSPREQMIPIELILDDSFVVKLLGHYHSRYPVGGPSLNTWYSGSSVRRGFSDASGDRGWLLVEIETDGNIKITPKNISQRPQYDLDTIDAANLNSGEVMELLEINMKRTLDTKVEPIVRQKIINAPRNLREGLDRVKIGELSERMLVWQLEFSKPETVKTATKSKDLSLNNKHSVNILEQYDGWIKKESENVPIEFREVVIDKMKTYLTTARDLHAHADQ